MREFVKEIFGSQSMAQGLKSPDKNYASMHPMDPKSLCTCACDLHGFEGFDQTLSAWLMLFCAECFISVVCLLPIILRRDNCAFIDYFKRLANERFHSF